jgi:hypothetical protein
MKKQQKPIAIHCLRKYEKTRGNRASQQSFARTTLKYGKYLQYLSFAVSCFEYWC